MLDDPQHALVTRLVSAASFLAAVLFAGATGYHWLGHGLWEWGDCFYMTIITLSTVGYGETLKGMHAIAGARAWTVMLILIGSGTLVYFVSTLTALIVEADLQTALKRKRMYRRIAELRDHIVVLGGGSTGIHVIQELLATLTPFVVVEQSEARIAHLREEFAPSELFIVQGDATEDEVLARAGLVHAKGVVAALHDDKDNLFATITVRSLNPKARIIAKAIEPTSAAKLRRAGADSVVSPSAIGGMRMVSEMTRPKVVEFLDLMLRDKDKNLRIEEISVPVGSSFCGRTLRDVALRKYGNVLVIAIRMPGDQMVYNPDSEHVLDAGQTLIVLTQTKDIAGVRAAVTG